MNGRGSRPPTSGLPEVGLQVRKSATADLRWLAPSGASASDGTKVSTVLCDRTSPGRALGGGRTGISRPVRNHRRPALLKLFAAFPADSNVAAASFAVIATVVS